MLKAIEIAILAHLTLNKIHWEISFRETIINAKKSLDPIQVTSNKIMISMNYIDIPLLLHKVLRQFC